MRKLNLFLFLFVYIVQYASSKFSLTVALLKFDNGQGLLANGDHCSQFWYAQMSCNIRLKVCIDWNLENNEPCTKYEGQEGTDLPQWIDLGEVTENENSVDFIERRYYAWSNPMQFIGNGSYPGFRISVIATEYKHDEAVIDNFSVVVTTNNTEANGFTFISHERKNATEPTLIGLAWNVIGGGVPLPPTDAPTTPTLGPTPDTSHPVDCNGFTDSGSKTIYPDISDHSHAIEVYCDAGKANGSYTVVQSRGNSGDPNANYKLNQNVSHYVDKFGQPGIDYNYWFGLKNFHTLTQKSSYKYGLRIDLCCGNTTARTLIYDNFEVAGADDIYRLSATPRPDSAAEGIDSIGNSVLNPKDIGSQFSTFDDYHINNISRTTCAALRYSRGDKTNSIGGWWFGSCTNNLNGYYYPPTDEFRAPFSGNHSCQIPLDPFDPNWRGTGIEMYTNNTGYAEGYLNGYSYTRVRMALFRMDLGLPVNTTDFCAANPSTGGPTIVPPPTGSGTVGPVPTATESSDKPGTTLEPVTSPHSD